jgi:aspartyl/asparaginyl beta-hydroxylase (cupin superfamily)
LEVPSNCRIRVGDEERSWAEGDVLIFDDSFEHEVWNDSDRERIVLIIDIWHPDLTDGQIAAIRLFGSPIVASAVAVATEWLQSGSVPRRLGKVDGGGDG